MAEETLKEETPIEPTGKYLTRKYLVQSFKDFWKSVKSYLEKALSEKVNTETGKGLSTNDFTTTEKNKLKGIAENANNYSHPTDSGNKHIPSGGQSGQILRWNSDGTAVWGDDNNTTYSEATENAAGLMSVTDKIKLNTIAEGANKITVETDIGAGTDNPVTGRAIKAALNKKVDKEDPETLEDPSNLVANGIIQGSSSREEGHIILKINQEVKNLKIHISSSNISNPIYKYVEKIRIMKDNEVIFANFQIASGLVFVTVENPEGKNTEGNWVVTPGVTFNFYIECLELIDGTKYKPFILAIGRYDPSDLTKIGLTFTAAY